VDNVRVRVRHRVRHKHSVACGDVRVATTQQGFAPAPVNNSGDKTAIPVHAGLAYDAVRRHDLSTVHDHHLRLFGDGGSYQYLAVGGLCRHRHCGWYRFSAVLPKQDPQTGLGFSGSREDLSRWVDPLALFRHRVGNWDFHLWSCGLWPCSFTNCMDVGIRGPDLHHVPHQRIHVRQFPAASADVTGLYGRNKGKQGEGNERLALSC